MEQQIAKAAEVIRAAEYVTAFTGAGISVESDIPAFRGKDGIWTKYPIEIYGTYSGFMMNPVKVWEFFKELYRILRKAKPNAAHFALARLGAAGKLRSIVTQNIDNLHQLAGSKNVIEFHGTGSTLECQRCGSVLPFSQDYLSEAVPSCHCGGVLKPSIVLLEEPIPIDALYKARAEALACDVMLVIGTSAQIVPASMLPVIAKQSGGIVIEFNLSKTVLSEEVADFSVVGSVGQTLPEVADLVLGGYIEGSEVW